MEQNNKKEQWIAEVLNSTEGMNKAQPGVDLFEKVMRNLDKPQSGRTVRLPVKQWAAAAVLLIALNVGSVIYFTQRNAGSERTDTANPLAPEILPGSTYNY